MKLHYHPLSPYSRKALVAVLMRGEAIELCEIAIGQGGLRQPEFLALSPFGKMPMLQTEDGPIIESTSIIEYLEERGPALLLPTGAERTARHFDRLGDHYLMAPMAELFWQTESELVKLAPQWLPAAWQLFETRLAGRDFVCGKAFSLGDLSAAIATDYLQRLGWQPPAAIDGWRQRCFAVPAMAQSLDMALPYVRRILGERAIEIG